VVIVIVQECTRLKAKLERRVNAEDAGGTGLNIIQEFIVQRASYATGDSLNYYSRYESQHDQLPSQYARYCRNMAKLDDRPSYVD
jgi:hypothetical protein